MTIRNLFEKNRNSYDDYYRKKKRSSFPFQLMVVVLLVGIGAYVVESEGALGENSREFVSWVMNEATTELAQMALSESVNTEDIAVILPTTGTLYQSFPVMAGENEEVGGIEIATAENAIVKAAATGTISELEQNIDGTFSLVIMHNEAMFTEYIGLATIEVSLGDEVKIGDTLGIAGDTPLYFAIFVDGEYVDPISYIRGL